MTSRRVGTSIRVPGRRCTFGAGAALIVDETALLIELNDVYRSDKGMLSIDVGLGATSALASLACAPDPPR